MNEIRRMLVIYLRQKRLILSAAALTLVKCACQLYLPLVMAEVINRGLLQSMPEVMTSGAVRMGAVCILMTLAGYIGWYINADASQRFAMELRQRCYRAVNGLSVLQVSRLGTGSLITRLTMDVDIVASFMSVLIQLLAEPMVLFLGGTILVYRISPGMGLVFLGFALVQLAVMFVFIYVTSPVFRRVREKTDAVNRYLQSTLSALRLVKAFCREPGEEQRSAAVNEELRAESFRAQRLVALFNPIVMLIMNMSIVFVLWYAGMGVRGGTMPVGNVMAVVTYSEQILMAIMVSGQLFRSATEAEPCSVRLCELLDDQPELTDGQQTLSGPVTQVSMEHVSYRYPSSGPVFRDLNLEFTAGQVLAVTGTVGCGKTTLAGLLARLFDADEGTVRLNGIPVTELPAAQVRRHVAMVEKQSEILGGSLMDNILFHRDYVNTSDALAAAKAACCEEFASRLPKGYDTQLGSMNLSGGERQRLALARALAGHPDVLILDDATASMDYATEKAVLGAIRREYPDMAVLLMTQRIPSANLADEICFLADGAIAARGTETELVRDCPAYARFIAPQREECL